jgi:hypothetical protein
LILRQLGLTLSAFTIPQYALFVTLHHTCRTLIIVKNYTGDVLQFGLARVRLHPCTFLLSPALTTISYRSAGQLPTSARTRSACSSSVRLRPSFLPYRFLAHRLSPTGDDVSVPRSQGKLTGRRGLAATTIVYKIAGALAAKGANIDEVEHIAKIVASNSGTFGVGLEHCHVPGTGQGEDHLKGDEMEIGMGEHRLGDLSGATSLILYCGADEILHRHSQRTRN